MAKRKDIVSTSGKPVAKADGAPKQTQAMNELPTVESPSIEPIAARSMHLQNRVLVTGGSGFLGSHLCERLLAEGAQVICLDNFFTGARVNVEHLLDHKRFELVRHDVTFPIYLEIG